METESEFMRRKGVLRAQWCVDSETSEECLIDIDNNVVIAKRVDGKMREPDAKSS